MFGLKVVERGCLGFFFVLGGYREGIRDEERRYSKSVVVRAGF